MEFFGDSKDYIMHEARKEDFTWESSVKLTLVGSEDLGMYFEEKEGRKRKWQGEGKMMRREELEEKEQRKMPPKKIMANLDMGGSGTSSSSSHLSPGWQVNDLDLDLPGELSMNEALLSLPSLAVFKQEAPSPTGNVLSPPRRAWPARRTDDRQITNMVVDNREAMDEDCQHNGIMNTQTNSPESMQCQSMPVVMPINGYHSPPNTDNKNGGLLMCSPVSSLDGFLHSPRPDSSFKDENRFQYVLAAATSIATKQNEETLTYLNQGQPYEIKLKKLGDLSHYKGKILKSIIKICFHERRLQYMEREQIAQWHLERPGERILEVDVPLSYGVSRVEQPAARNQLLVRWDPTQDVGVYVKVNCISTEFTAKKHGGEKGVPFRIQVETLHEDRRLHAAACQIKVFKLKGADRKHKQDRERVLRRPRGELERYQPGCDATVLTALSSDALMPPPSLVTTSPPYSPEMCIAPKTSTSPILVNKPVLSQPSNFSTNNQMKPLYCQENDVKASSPSCHSPGAILPDLPQPAEEPDKNQGLSKDASASETQAWLAQQRFNHHMMTFTNFSGADLLRLSRDDIIQICGLADGIRLYNALHAKRIEPRLTLYVCPSGGAVYSAVYLHACRAHELLQRLRELARPAADCETVLVSGPNGTRVRLTDELVRHLPDNSTYTLAREQDALLLCAWMTSMEDLLQTQEQISVAIEQLYSNFKKDSAERKNNDYIKRRLMTLDGYWQEYQSNHIKLCGLGDKSHSYFTSNQYEISKDRFANIKSAIQHFEPLIKETLPPLIRPATPLGVPKGQHDQQSTGQAHQGSSSKTDELLKKQSSNFKAFEHTITNIMLDTVSEKWEFDHLLRILNARWSAIDSLHWELDNELGGRDPSYETAFFKYEQAYNDVIKSINKKMWSISHRNQSTPQIEIPTFSGGYHQWNSFKDLFTETIHSNPSLSSAQKMQFLKSKVKGESERLIQHLPISSDNYSICWDILNHRFDNKKLILNSHIDIMLSIPVASQPSYSHIKRIHDYLLESLNAIKNLGIEVDSWDPLLIYLMCQKLDSDTHKEYVVSVKNPREVPKLQEFLSFLENKFTTIESTRCKQEQIFKKPIIRNGNQNHQSFFGSKYPKSNNYNSKQLFQNNGRAISQSLPRKYVYVAKMFKCPICETDDHGLFHCKQFINMLQPLKGDTVVKYKLCQNCLYCHHGKACISEKRCRECNQAHNTLLHGAFEKLEPPAGAMNSNNMRDVSKYEYPQAGRSNSHVSLQRDIPEILLATAQVKVQKTDGTYIILRALLDQGSQASLITENAAQLLGLPRQRCHGIISGVGIKESNCKGTIHIKCSAINNDFEFETDTLIMKNLIRNLPSYSFIKPTWSYLDNITLADPEFNHSKPVDLLLGADIYSLILLEGICRSDQNSPVAQNTRLGWILSGNIKTLHCNVVLTNLKEIHKFWEIEDITEKSNLSTEDEQCVQYYKDKTTRREDGRYEVRLPLKSNFKENLGKSKAKAIAQFQSLERKFRKNESMQNDYTSFMKEYQSLGHMVPAANTTTPDCYLTHHGVERAESSSTKFRVVPI